MVTTVPTTTWQSWTATGRLWWRRAVAVAVALWSEARVLPPPCHLQSQVEVTPSTWCSPRIAFFQIVVGVSAGERWQVLTTNQDELFCFLQRLKRIKKKCYKQSLKKQTALILIIAGATTGQPLATGSTTGQPTGMNKQPSWIVLFSATFQEL